MLSHHFCISYICFVEIRNKTRDYLAEAVQSTMFYHLKGLEFNDVLLYNFFSPEASLRSHWAVGGGGTWKDISISDYHSHF